MQNFLTVTEIDNINTAVLNRGAYRSLVNTKLYDEIINKERKKLAKYSLTPTSLLNKTISEAEISKGLGKYFRKNRNAFLPLEIYSYLQKENKEWLQSMGYLYKVDTFITTSEGKQQYETISKQFYKQHAPKEQEIKSLAGFKVVQNTNHKGNSVLYHLLDNNGNVIATDVTRSDIGKKIKYTEEAIKQLPLYWIHKDASITQEFSLGGIISSTKNFLNKKVTLNDFKL